jgi:GNAT superfamily N-acetyltransferase
MAISSLKPKLSPNPPIMSSRPEIYVLDELSEDEEQAVNTPLTDFSLAHGVVWEPEPLNLVLRHEGRIIGGLRGKMQLGWLYVSVLGVASEWRGQGHGAALLARAEQEAARRGCSGVWLHTFTYEAPEFYRKQGYDQFGVLDEFPRGHQRLFFVKRLAG